jgi:hypothetical protein
LVAYIEESLFLVAEGVRGVADGDGDLIQMIDGPEASPPSENTVTTVDAPTSATVDGWPTPASEKMLDVMVDDVKSREWVERLLADGAPVVEFAAPATDSFAALRAGGLDLALAGIPPLRQMLDDLTGMPDVVACQANSWNRISTDLRRIGADLRSQLDRDFAGQHGRQVRAYQAFMSHNVDAVGGLTATSNALAVVTKAAGDLILLTRDIVRGLIADLVVRVIVWVAETTVVSMSVMASRLATVISTGWRIQAYVTALVTSMSNLAWYVDVNE